MQKKETITKIRIDKWLWSVRLFKTRSKATEACKSGKIKDSEKGILKPSSDVEIGDTLQVSKNGINYTIFVKKLIAKRVSSPLALECYEDRTPQEELDRYESWFLPTIGKEYREKGLGRPTKKDRRNLDKLKFQ